MLCLFSIQIFLFSGGIFMADNDVQVKKASAMAGRLKKVFDECGGIVNNDIPVPLDVKERMKRICSETEKILKNMPNKKFSAAIHISNEKAKKYFGVIKEEMEKVYYNYSAFSTLEEFYGKSGNDVKSSIKKYDDRMKKYDKEFKAINLKVDKFINDNPGLSRIELDSWDMNEEDQKLISWGRIGRLNLRNETYFDNVKAFFNRFINYKIDGKKDLVAEFEDVSDTLRNIKNAVAKNEEAVLKSSGIQTTRNNAYEMMGEISGDLKEYLNTANHCVEFLNSLYIKNPELSKERDASIKGIETAIQEYTRKLVAVREFRSSIKYGETTFNIKGDQKKLAMGTNKVKETFFDAAGVRDSCNNFIKNLKYILNGIKSGQKVENVYNRIKILNKSFDSFVNNLNEFLKDAKNFEGYYNTSNDGKNITEEDKNTLRSVHAKYVDIYKELTRIHVNNMYATKEKANLEKMEKKIKKEVEEYNKVSSKIKRGVKKVFNVMGTIARYTLNVTEFLKNVLFISDTWCGLANSLSKNDEAAAQVIAVPIARS